MCAFLCCTAAVAAEKAAVTDRVAATQQVGFDVYLPLQHEAELDSLLTSLNDPNSANYHKWLTPEEFGDRFGLAEEDVKYVAGWLITEGFTVNEIARSRTWISFSGTAARVYRITTP